MKMAYLLVDFVLFLNTKIAYSGIDFSKDCDNVMLLVFRTLMVVNMNVG